MNNQEPRARRFSLGSPESEAAARAMAKAQQRDKDVRIRQIVYVSPDGARTNGPLYRIPASSHRQ